MLTGMEFSDGSTFYPATGNGYPVGIGLGGTAELGPSKGIFRTVLWGILVILGLTSAVGLVTKLMEATFFGNIFEARSINMNTVEMVMKTYSVMKALESSQRQWSD